MSDPDVGVDDIVLTAAAVCAVLLVGAAYLRAAASKVTEVKPTADRAVLLNDGKLPSYFKYRESLLVPVRDQASCSSCWAFSVADILADTLSIRSGGAWKRAVPHDGHLSPQYLLSCCPDIHFGCKMGGSPEDAYESLEVTRKGVPLESDLPYVGEVTACPALPSGALRVRTLQRTMVELCEDPDLALPGFRQSIIDANVRRMKAALISYGPISGTVRITDDFYSYDGDAIFEAAPDSPVHGYHAVLIHGWCDEAVNTGEPNFEKGYWMVKNSYSEKFGVPQGSNMRYGYIYVRMGTNESCIESRASIAQVEIPQIIAADVRKHDIRKSVYLSYDEYAEDPERVNYFSALHKARKEEEASMKEKSQSDDGNDITQGRR